MRGAVFLAVIALCALTDEVSAVARAGGAGSRAGKSKGSGRRLSNGSNAGGDRHRPGETTAVAAGLKRDKTEAPSHDGAHVNVRDQSAVVIGAIREERGRQRFASRKRLWDEDDIEEEGEEDGDDDWGDDEEDQHDAILSEEGEGEEGGDGSFSEETELVKSEEMEQTEEEEEEYGTEARGRGNGNGNGNGNGRNTGKTTAGAPAYGGARGARSSSHPNRRARYGDDHFGRGERGRGTAGPQPSSRNKAKAKGGVMKSVGKATGSSMKAMVHALQPKAVGLGEILDTWKIEQIIGKPPGRVTKCAATVEFRRDGTVATSFDGRETVSDFTFRAHAWPRACTIEFEAKAFQGPWDEEPVWKVYKGSFSRKLLDPKIITLEGTIYDVMGKMMWKRRVKSGKFTARRRPTRLSRGGGGGGPSSSRNSSARRSNITPDREDDERWGEGARARSDRGGGDGTKRNGNGNGNGNGKGSRRSRSSRPAGSGSGSGSGRSRRRDEL